MTIKELRDFIYQSYYRRIGFPKENSCYSMKQKKKENFTLICNQIDRKNT